MLDDYVVDKVLGEGGMGKVYLVQSRSTGSRFAVKRAKGLKDVDRRNFLAELQTWIDLPEHNNLVTCRFFRTVGNEILMFADYVEGGSLKDWIDSRKLYEGSPQETLGRMLDVAIQFAWGLHCVHELGLVHQDVKPGNVMMAVDGKAAVQGVTAKVADYGLARARAAGGESQVIDSAHSILVSNAGGTPAYWSPEQSQGSPVTRKTDIWSWGVSVMEMFTGGVVWISGRGAAAVLEQHEKNATDDETIPAMPAKLVVLLRECFLDNPSERRATLGEAVEILKRVYLDTLGTTYPNSLDLIEEPVSSQSGIKERRTAGGHSWTAPQVWLERALHAVGRDPAQAAAMLSQRGSTRRGELVAELADYDQANRLYDDLVKHGRSDLASDFAELLTEKALVHQTTGDYAGALQELDHAIAIWEHLVKQEGRSEFASDLANAYTRKASTVAGLGDHRAALALFDRAIVIRERLDHQEGRQELHNSNLASVYHNKANALRALGDHRAALAPYAQAIEIWECLVGVHHELRADLALAYGNKANAVSGLGDLRAAATLYAQAIVIWERLVHQEGRREFYNDLAGSCNNKALALSGLGDHRAAVALYDQAIETRERLVHQEGRRELANDLAAIYYNKALAVSDLGDRRAAVALYNQAIEIRERLVHQEGRRELAKSLASAYNNKAIAIAELGDPFTAVPIFVRAIAIWEHLVNQEGHSELANDLAGAYRNKGIAARSEPLNPARSHSSPTPQGAANNPDWVIVMEFGSSKTYVDRKSIDRRGAFIRVSVRYALSPMGTDKRNGKPVKEMLMIEEYDTTAGRFRVHSIQFVYGDDSASEPLSVEPAWNPATAGNQKTLEFLYNFINHD